MDAEVVVRAQEGDQGAFATLATATYGRLHRVAQHILGDLQLAEDATQQAVLEIWRSLPRLEGPDRFEAWSYRILVNACYAEIRRSKRWIAGMDLETELDPAADRAITGVVYRDQLERGFRRVPVDLRRVPVDQRAVLVLHHLPGITLEETAGVLDIPVGTAHSRLSRAMPSLRAALEADARLPGPEPSLESAR